MTTRDDLLRRFEDAVERRDRPAADAALAAMPADVTEHDISLTVLMTSVNCINPDEDDLYWLTLADGWDEERGRR